MGERWHGFLQQPNWPLGAEVKGFTPPPMPRATAFSGTHGHFEPLALKHATPLAEAFAADVAARSFTYLPYGPFRTSTEFAAFIAAHSGSKDPMLYACVDGHERVVGIGGYLHIQPQLGSIELGHMVFSPALQGTTLATELVFRLADWAFTHGYRRVEWKCDSLNAASRRAALRFGFEFEGVFRQAAVVRGRNRDTAWFALIDQDWPRLKRAYEAWLHPHNFDSEGRQLKRLSECREM